MLLAPCDVDLFTKKVVPSYTNACFSGTQSHLTLASSPCSPRITQKRNPLERDTGKINKKIKVASSDWHSLVNSAGAYLVVHSASPGWSESFFFQGCTEPRKTRSSRATLSLGADKKVPSSIAIQARLDEIALRSQKFRTCWNVCVPNVFELLFLNV